MIVIHSHSRGCTHPACWSVLTDAETRCSHATCQPYPLAQRTGERMTLQVLGQVDEPAKRTQRIVRSSRRRCSQDDSTHRILLHIGSYSFVWSLTTLILNRSLFNMRKATLKNCALSLPIQLSALNSRGRTPDSRREHNRGSSGGSSSNSFLIPKPEDSPHTFRTDTAQTGAMPVRSGMQILSVATLQNGPFFRIASFCGLETHHPQPATSRPRVAPRQLKKTLAQPGLKG